MTPPRHPHCLLTFADGSMEEIEEQEAEEEGGGVEVMDTAGKSSALMYSVPRL